MPGWVPFTGLTIGVLFLLLGLARLSQGVVTESPPELPAGDETAGQTTAVTDRPDEGSSATDGGAASEAVTAIERVDGVESAPAPDGDGADEETEPWEADPVEPPEQAEFTTGALLANVAFTQGLFGAAIAVGAWYYDIPAAALGIAAEPMQTGMLAVAVGVAFGVVLWLANEATAAVADAVGAAYDESLREMLTPDTAGGWVLLLGVILPLIAVVEELIFRAALIGVPAAGFDISPWALAIFSSAMFAFGHGAQGRAGIVVTGGLGFVLAGGYILSGSLLVVVIAHYLVNALEFVVHEGLGADRLFA